MAKRTTTSEPLIGIFVDAATGEVIERELTVEEIAELPQNVSADAPAEEVTPVE